jgi:hypothetical protein
MSPFFDDLETQLATAARAQTAVQHTTQRRRTRRRRGPRRLTSGARTLPVALGVAVALAVALIIVLVGHRHPPAPHPSATSNPPASQGPIFLLPQHPTPEQRTELTYLSAAEHQVAMTDRGCGLHSAFVGGNPGRAPNLSQGSPSPALLAMLGVLRRPQTPTDKLPPRIIGPPGQQQVYPNGTIPQVHEVYLRYIRKARHRYGANYYLVPAGNINPLLPVPPRCLTMERAALRTLLPRIPASLRAGTLRLMRLWLEEEQHNSLPYPGVCLIGINDTGNGGGSCPPGSISEIENGRAFAGGAPTGVEVYYGLAPDGVRSITFTFDSKYVHDPITALVINNVVIVRNYRGRLGPIASEIWRAPDGHIIKTIRHPYP